jgi:hypothetical protein
MINFIEKIENYFKRKPKYNDKEAKLLEVVNKMVTSPDVDLVCNPMNGVYYISNEKIHYYMKVTEFEITITNTKFAYNHVYTSGFGTQILNIVRDAVNQQVEEFDRKVFINEVNLLTNIEKAIR